MRDGNFGSLASFGFSVGLRSLTMCQMWVGRKIKNVRGGKITNTVGSAKRVG